MTPADMDPFLHILPHSGAKINNAVKNAKREPHKSSTITKSLKKVDTWSGKFALSLVKPRGL